jgi:hypothetical protein
LYWIALTAGDCPRQAQAVMCVVLSASVWSHSYRRLFLSMFTIAYHCPYPLPDEYSSHPHIRFIYLNRSSYLHLGLPCGLFICFSIKSSTHYSFPPGGYVCPPHPSSLS